MKRALIAIGILLLVTLAAANQNKSSDDIVQLGYNPTYDLWFFRPRGRPDKVPPSVQAAYNEEKPGGVCFKPEDTWFFCTSGKKIK